MAARRIALVVTLAVLGVAAATGLGLAANAISGSSIGLSAKPLRAGDSLSAQEPAARTSSGRAVHRLTTTGGDRRGHGRDDTATTTKTTPTRSSSSSSADDHGSGKGRGRGRGGGDD